MFDIDTIQWAWFPKRVCTLTGWHNFQTVHYAFPYLLLHNAVTAPNAVVKLCNWLRNQPDPLKHKNLLFFALPNRHIRWKVLPFFFSFLLRTSFFSLPFSDDDDIKSQRYVAMVYCCYIFFWTAKTNFCFKTWCLDSVGWRRGMSTLRFVAFWR